MGEPPSNKPRSRKRSRSGIGAWSRLHLWQIQPLRDVAVVASVIGLIWLGSVISVVTVPLLLALLLAYLLEPVVRLIVRSTPLKRRGAVLLMLASLVVLVVVPAIVGVGAGVAEGLRFAREVREDVAAVRASVAAPDDERLARLVPEGTWRGVRDGLIWARENVGEDTEAPDPEGDPNDGSAAGEPGQANVGAGNGGKTGLSPTASKPEHSTVDAALKWVEDNAGAIARSLFQTGGNAIEALIGMVGALASFGLMAFLTAFFFFFVSTGFPNVTDFLENLVPEANRERALELISKLDRVVSGFVRGRLIIGLILGAFFSLGWWLAGVPLALAVGMATGLLGVFPYAALAGLPVAVVLLALENHAGFRGTWWWVVLAPAAIYQVGQLADDYLLTPSIQGKETDLDIPSIMFAVFAGGALFGIYGLLIAIPFAACLKILIREIIWPRYRAWVRGERKDLLPLDPD